MAREDREADGCGGEVEGGFVSSDIFTMNVLGEQWHDISKI